MRRFLPFVGLATIAAAPIAPPPPAAGPAVLAWLTASGGRFATAEPSADELAPIVARLKGGRIIGIGEVTHGTHEDQAFKAALIKELVKAGAVDTLALEANRNAGRAFDRYVRLGEGDPAAAVRSSSFFRIWRGDEFAGLILWLRAWNLAHPDAPVRVVGIDNQDAGVDAGFALAFLAKRDPALATKLRPAFGTLMTDAGGRTINPAAWVQDSKPGEMPAALAAAVTLRDTFEANAAAWGSDPDFAEARHAARIAWQGLYEFEREVGIVDVSTLPADYASRRDVFMAANLDALLSPGAHAVVWAHDGHVGEVLPTEIAAKGYMTVGTELEKRLGESYRTVGFTYSRATVLTRRVASFADDYSKPQADEPMPLANDRPQDVGSVFARLPGDARWFDLDTKPGSPTVAAWLAKPMWRGDAGLAVRPDSFQTFDKDDLPLPNGAAFDILVWFRTMTPQHRWPVAPKPPVAVAPAAPLP